MNHQELKAWNSSLEEIEKNKDDCEVAHQYEDQVYLAFVQEIADGKIKTLQDAQEVAQIILKSKDISFPRYFS